MTYTSPSGNFTTGVEFFQWINSSIGDFFIPGIVVAAFFVILIKLMFNSGEIGKSLGAASFICMILSIFFRVANLVSTGFMVIFIILTGVSIVWMHLENAGAAPQ